MKTLLHTYLFSILALMLLFSGNIRAEQATDIRFNEIPGNVHPITDLYKIYANDVELPVIDGMRSGQPGYLDYNYTTFWCSEGDVTVKIKAKDKIASISVHPLKLEIPVTKIDDYTYSFVMKSDYYLFVKINGRRVVITRDKAEADVPTPGVAGVFNIADDLKTLNAASQANTKNVAKAIQQTVDKASAYGTTNGTQGIVYIPKGLYYMGNLKLKSNIALYLAPGAVIKFSDNKTDYRYDFTKKSRGDGTWWIYTDESTSNIKIYGRGTIDGNGYYMSEILNPRFISHVLLVMGTDGFVFDGPIIKEGSFWTVVLARSKNITFKNYKQFNAMWMGEDDGIDVCESQNVLVQHSIAIALDDPYSTKTWDQTTDICPKWYGTPQELRNVTFDDCHSLTFCGAFKLGHGAMTPQYDVTVKNSVVHDCGRALGVEPKYGNGKYQNGFHNVTFENVDIESGGEDGWLSVLLESRGVGNPALSNLVLKNINIRSKGGWRRPPTLMGLDKENQIEGVTFDHIYLYGNTDPVGSLAEMGVTNTGYFKNLKVLPDRSREANYKIEAEYYNNKVGDAVVSTNAGANADAAYPKGAFLSTLAKDTYLVFNNVDFGSSTGKMNIRYYALLSHSVELRLDSPDGQLIGTLAVDDSKKNTWADYEIPLSGANGMHNLYILFKDTRTSLADLARFNFFELKERAFVNLVSIEPKETSPVEVNIDKSVALEVKYIPEDAYQKELIWSIESQSESGVVDLTESGVVKGLKVGTARVKAVSTYDTNIFTYLDIKVTDAYQRDVYRIEAENADILFGVDYQNKEGIKKGASTDPSDVGGQALINIWQNNYAVYKNVDFKEFTTSINVRKEFPRTSKIEFWIDRTIESNGSLSGGTLIGSQVLENSVTGWSLYHDFDVPVVNASGVHDLYVIFTAAGTTATNQQFGGVNWFELTRALPSGIDRISKDVVTVYPNPTTGKFFVQKADETYVIIYDDLGRKLSENTDSEQDISDFAAGIYFVKINDRTLKLIKK